MRSFWTVMVLLAFAAVALFWSGWLDGRDESEPRSVTTGGIRPDDDLLTAGRTVQVKRAIDGDLAVAGSRVEVSGPVEGYVMAAGRDVSVNQPVANDVWAAGARVFLAGPVGDNAWLAGRTVVVGPEATVSGDLRVGAADVTLGSEVSGSVAARAERVRVLPGAVIHGDLVVSGPRPPEVAAGAQVRGQTRYRSTGTERSRLAGWLSWWLWSFLAIFCLGAAALAVSPRDVERVAVRVWQRPVNTAVAGILGLLLIPLVAVLMAVTIIGIPLAIVLLALYGVIVVLSCVFVAYRVGGWMFTWRPQTRPYPQLAIGALSVTVLATLPWIGWVVQGLVLMLGSGALLLTWKDTRRPLTV
jgi:cytoskeletal protein CcmA (bactofilin family)